MILLHEEKLYDFLPRSGTRQEYLLSPLLFNIILEVLDNKIRKGNKKYTGWDGKNNTVHRCDCLWRKFQIINNNKKTPGTKKQL